MPEQRAAADLVTDSAPGHGVQRALRHAQRLRLPLLRAVIHQKQQIVGRGEFGRLAEAAPSGIKALLKRVIGLLQQPQVGISSKGGRRPAHHRCDLVTGLQQLLPLIVPEENHPLQQLQQSGPAIPALLWKIGSGEKGPLLCGH